MDDRLRYPSPNVYGSTVDQYAQNRNQKSVRERHIEELKREVPDCRSKDASQSLWELPLVTIDGRPVHLCFNIDPSYPKVPPRVSIKEFKNFDHCWVNKSTGVMTVHCLEDWAGNDRVPSLTTVVRNVYVAITGRQYVPDSAASQPAGSLPSMNQVNVPRQELKAKLNVMSNEELAELVTNDAKFEALMKAEMAETAGGKHLESLLRKQAAMAKANLAQVKEYEGMEQQLLITKQGELPPAEKCYNDVMARQTAIISKLDASSMLSVMQEELEAADEKSALTEQEFLSCPDITEQKLAAFVSHSQQQRTAYHALEIKLKAARTLKM